MKIVTSNQLKHKSLGFVSSTIVNNYTCLSEDSYICSDCWRKVSDIMLLCFLFVQHEKYTSQLQLSLKTLEAKAKEKQQLQNSEKIKGSASKVKLQDRAERRAHSLTGIQFCPRRTPLWQILAGRQRVLW